MAKKKRFDVEAASELARDWADDSINVSLTEYFGKSYSDTTRDEEREWNGLRDEIWSTICS